MNLGDRLRSVVRSGGPATQDPPYASVSDHVHRTCAAEILGGEWCEARGQKFVVVEHRFPVGHRLGRVSVGECLPPADGAWRALPLLVGNSKNPNPAAGRMLFVDLETTGLAGGAGTRAFLVGIGWFENFSFRVRQLLLTSYIAERVLLEELAALAADTGTLVTYNGKSFDLPLIETRFLFHRIPPPFDGVPHLDMLHRARRLWRARSDDGPRADASERSQTTCRLSAVEQAVLGYEREGDVSGFEVPARYFHFVRTGDARPLAAVFEHNRLDLLSLAMLTATAATLLHEGPESSHTAHEALGLGRLFELGGEADRARQCFARATHLGGDPLTHAEALRAYAVSCRRTRQFDEAAEAWRRMLALDDCPRHLAQEATDALAVHHEHRLRDFGTARTFAARALRLTTSDARLEAARHRIARLDRKLAPLDQPAPLFP